MNNPVFQAVVQLDKTTPRRQRPDIRQRQIDKIVERALAGRRRERGWDVRVEDKGRQETAQHTHLYTYILHISFLPKRETPLADIKVQFESLIKIISEAAGDWEIAFVNGKKPRLLKENAGPVGYAHCEVPATWESYFSGIFDRQEQIDIIRSSLEAGILSDWYDRFHCALIGEPACGKTEILRCVKEALGDDAVMEYDATATTQAGAIKDIDQREFLPRVLIVEEIEKTDEDSLRWLLGVLDTRAEIRKTTHRETIWRETKMLCLATVNDFKLFRKLMYGALASRFAWQLHCPRPNRNVLRLILEREVNRIQGDHRWIDATLDFAEKKDIYDPRMLRAICLCGRDKLLKGLFQRKIGKCSTEEIETKL